MDHVIRSCDVILQHRHGSSILLQVIIVAMEMCYHGTILGGMLTRTAVLYGDYTEWNNFFY